MKTINLTLKRNNSDTNTFIIIDEITSEELLTKDFQIDEPYSFEVRDDLRTLIINSNNGNDDFDFVSSSFEI